MKLVAIICSAIHASIEARRNSVLLVDSHPIMRIEKMKTVKASELISASIGAFISIVVMSGIFVAINSHYGALHPLAYTLSTGAVTMAVTMIGFFIGRDES